MTDNFVPLSYGPGTAGRWDESDAEPDEDEVESPEQAEEPGSEENDDAPEEHNESAWLES